MRDGLDLKDIEDIVANDVERALQEDVGDGDITAHLIAPEAIAVARVIARETMTLAGRHWFDRSMRCTDERIDVRWHFDDGEQVAEGSEICRVSGPARAILTAERCALNFVQLLSAVATVTAQYVAETAGTHCQILDTRKTIPGLRAAQKYAVRCGGGSNHRFGLFDAILIKENHIASAGGIAAAIGEARVTQPEMPVEVEVETLDEMRQALEAGAERMLLDNFSLDLLREAVSINAASESPAHLEASGGLLLGDIAAVAATGVDFISIGALTKNIAAVDLSMRFD